MEHRRSSVTRALFLSQLWCRLLLPLKLLPLFLPGVSVETGVSAVEAGFKASLADGAAATPAW